MENFRKMLVIANKLAAADPSDARAAFDRGMALRMTAASFPPDRDHAESLAMLRESLAILQGLAAKDPQDRNLPLEVWFGQVGIAQRLAQAGETAAAIRADREVIRSGAALTGRSHDGLFLLHGLMLTYQYLASVQGGSVQKSEAVEFSREAVKMALEARKVDPRNAVTQSWAPAAYAAAGAVQARWAATRGEWAQACNWYEKAASGWEEIHPQHGWPDDRDSELARVKAEAVRCARTLASLH